VAELKGFMYPRTPTGKAGILAGPPWHYSGEMLTVEFRTDPAKVAALLPGPLAPAADDPGACALIWADWQSCSDDFSELLDPLRCQYREVFLVVRCVYKGTTYSRAAYIWVDKDFAMARGHVQGYPKKLGEIAMTRPVTLGRAGPRLIPGGRFGATLSTWGRRIADARFTITGSAETAGFVNGHPMLHSRQMPAIEMDGRDSLDELVTMRGYDADLGPVHSGDAELDLFEHPTEELKDLDPIEIIGGYYRQVANSMAGGTTVWAADNPMAARQAIAQAPSPWQPTNDPPSDPQAAADADGQARTIADSRGHGLRSDGAAGGRAESDDRPHGDPSGIDDPPGGDPSDLQAESQSVWAPR